MIGWQLTQYQRLSPCKLKTTKIYQTVIQIKLMQAHHGIDKLRSLQSTCLKTITLHKILL